MLYISRNDPERTFIDFLNSDKAEILIIYGRRRVGKTTLIENTIPPEQILKIEGIENENEEFQIINFVRELLKKFPNKPIPKNKINTWLEAFEFAAELLKKSPYVLYLEELQWMANYNTKLIAHLKHTWDNYFSKIPKFKLILCGSAPSFFETNIIRSQALYNRSMTNLHLEEFTISEAKSFLPKKNIKSFFDAYLTVGGIPMYLEKLNEDASIIQALAVNSFKKESFFSIEFKKIFVSNFSNNKNYYQIISYLGKHKKATRKELCEKLNITSSGLITKYLVDLESCGFINKQTNIDSKSSSAKSIYTISDPYLNFYFSFIETILSNIQKGTYNKNPMSALNLRSYYTWLGFSFERFCRQNSHIFAEILGFSGIYYTSGSLFNKKSLDKNFQFDLVFKRADKILTLCEIKYVDKPIDVGIIEEFEVKLEKLNIKASQSIQRVLITASKISTSLAERSYFDRIIYLEDILKIN